MGWGKVAEYIMAFLRWLWQNKWTILFMTAFFVLICMYGCQKKEIEKLETKLEKAKVENEICENQKEIAINCNTDLQSGLDLCQKELHITKDSYKEAEAIKEQFDLEIAKYEKLAKEIDSESDPEKALEKKKALVEELFKGKSNSQINTIKANIKLKIKNFKLKME